VERHLADHIGTLADALSWARALAGITEEDGAVVRRSSARGGGWSAVLSNALAPPAPEPAFERLARAAPELEALALLSDGSLGPLLALPDDWLVPPAR